MLVTVSWPIALLGRISSILGSFAVRLNRASAEIRRPGAMAPPRYSPAAVTAQKVVAVPKSTMMIGPPYRRLGAAPVARPSPAPPPVGQEFGAVEDAPDDVRVTDVNGQQHALQRREASACGFRSREVLAERRSN